jgi:hypothetical protein
MSASTAAFAVAATTLHAVFGDVVQYVAPPAAAVDVTVVKRRVDEAIGFGGLETQVRAAGWQWDVEQSLIPTRPRVGTDYFVAGAVTYRIRDVQDTAERTIWVLDVSEA